MAQQRSELRLCYCSLFQLLPPSYICTEYTYILTYMCRIHTKDGGDSLDEGLVFFSITIQHEDPDGWVLAWAYSPHLSHRYGSSFDPISWGAGQPTSRGSNEMRREDNKEMMGKSKKKKKEEEKRRDCCLRSSHPGVCSPTASCPAQRNRRRRIICEKKKRKKKATMSGMTNHLLIITITHHCPFT